MAQSARADREHDVVDRAAVAGLGRLDVGEIQAHGGEMAGTAHRPVQARLRRADHLLAHDQLDGGPHVVERLARVPRRAETGSRAANDQARREPEVAVVVPAVLAAADGQRLRGQRRGQRGGVEQQVSDVERADAINEAVVGLARQRPAPSLQSVEKRHLPQRPVAVQAVRPEVPEPLVQLGLATRRRQRRVMDVGVDVEGLRRLPREPGERARMRARELLGETRQDADASAHVVAELGDVRRSATGERIEDERQRRCACARTRRPARARGTSCPAC